MAILKNDLHSWGTTLTNYLEKVGKQISDSQDIKKVEMLSKKLQNLGDVTINPKTGKPRTYEEIAGNLLSHTGFIAGIKNPMYMNQANNLLNTSFNTAIKSATQRSQNQFNTDITSVSDPQNYLANQNIANTNEPSLATYNFPKNNLRGIFSPKGVWRQHPDNADMMQYVLPITGKDGSDYGVRVIGESLRTDLSTQEQIALKERQFETQLEVSLNNQKNYNFSTTHHTGEAELTTFKNTATNETRQYRTKNGFAYDVNGNKVNLEKDWVQVSKLNPASDGNKTSENKTKVLSELRTRWTNILEGYFADKELAAYALEDIIHKGSASEKYQQLPPEVQQLIWQDYQTYIQN